MSGPGTSENPRDQSGASIPGDAAPIPQVTYGHARTQKRLKQQPNPLFVNPLSALSAEVCARFPTELHDYIIDHLHNDKRALLACSLVSTIWSTSSRYHLFQNACTIHVDRRNFRQFCELLATQRLNIYIGRLHLKSHVIDERFAGGPNETFQFNDHLHLLAGLPSLKYLFLEYHHDSLLPGFFVSIAQNFASVTDLAHGFRCQLSLSAHGPSIALAALPAFYPPSGNCNGRVVLHQSGHHICLRCSVNVKRKSRALDCFSGPLVPHRAPHTRNRWHPTSATQQPRQLSMGPCAPLPPKFPCTAAHNHAGLDLLDWLRLAEILGGICSLRRVNFYLSSHKNWATQVIAERLGPRTYALRVNQLEGQYEYSLGMFDH
ncbi:hypothetical protein B0H14DRAFT_3021111 [Mycena olivaceomarginata]|nr:hypothetical protein B0H14DRAFT_3021111 [Mycena olivaceomarginata]